MLRGLLTRLVLLLIAVAIAAFTSHSKPPPPIDQRARVLFIGIDGCRTDAVFAAKTPNLHALMETGAYSTATNILGTRDDAADTVSGPGWSNLLTGVWADKHGVLNNNFKITRYGEYPHFFSACESCISGRQDLCIRNLEADHRQDRIERRRLALF